MAGGQLPSVDTSRVAQGVVEGGTAGVGSREVVRDGLSMPTPPPLPPRQSLSSSYSPAYRGFSVTAAVCTRTSLGQGRAAGPCPREGADLASPWGSIGTWKTCHFIARL